MSTPTTIDWNSILTVLVTVIGIVLLITLILVGWIIWRVRKINLSPDADFLTALLATPLVVVVVLDLLDFSLDIFSAPFTWLFLSWLGLAPLRGVAVVKDLVPFTNFVPLMTLAWVFARVVEHNRNSGATLPRLK